LAEELFKRLLGLPNDDARAGAIAALSASGLGISLPQAMKCVSSLTTEASQVFALCAIAKMTAADATRTVIRYAEHNLTGDALFLVLAACAPRSQAAARYAASELPAFSGNHAVPDALINVIKALDTLRAGNFHERLKKYFANGYRKLSIPGDDKILGAIAECATREDIPWVLEASKLLSWYYTLFPLRLLANRMPTEEIRQFKDHAENLENGAARYLKNIWDIVERAGLIEAAVESLGRALKRAAP
jgi:hypothetical protein